VACETQVYVTLSLV